MKKSYCLLVLLFAVFNAAAQATWCRAVEPTQSEKGLFIQKLQVMEAAKARQAAETVTYVAVKIHLLSKATGPVELPDSQVKEMLDTLNTHFIRSNIQFYQCGEIDNIRDDKFYIFDTAEETSFCKKYDVNNAINLYLVKQFTDTGLGGYTYFPSSKKSTNRIFCSYNSVSDLIAKILPHEMGHYFALMHTFQDSNLQTYAELVSRGDRGNCAYRGDLLCDTPADPYGRRPISINNCQFTSPDVDANGESFSPQLGNLMSYYRGCGNFFTPGQQSMMKTGLLIRMIQDSDKSQAYSIDCKGVSSNVILVQDIYQNESKLSNYSQICVGKPFSVTFTTAGDFNADNEFKVYLLADNSTYSTEIGSGTGGRIDCVIPVEIPITSNLYRLQVVSRSPVLHSTLSNTFFYVTKIPTAEISGSFNLFANESVTIPVKLTGGYLTLQLSNNFGFSLSSITNKAISIPVRQSEVIRITSVSNACGIGEAKGQVEINLIPRPVATNFVVESLTGTSVCRGTTVKLSLKSNGVFNDKNVFSIQLSDANGENFRTIATHSNPTRLPEFGIPADTPEGSAYKLKVISTSPAYEYVLQDLSIQSPATAYLSGNAAIANGEKASLHIRLTGTPPFRMISMNDDTLISPTNGYQWLVTPNETRTYSLKSVSNNTCDNGLGQGSAEVKVSFPLKTSLLNVASVCAGGIIKVPFKLDEGVVVGNGFIVQLSDNGWKNPRNIIINGNTSPLEVVIPADLPEGDKYRVRVVSKDGRFVGSESNQFTVRTKPTAILNGAVAGNKGAMDSFPLKLAGGGPWKVSLVSDNQESAYVVNQSPDRLPVTIQGNNIYKLGSVSNACGTGSVYGQAVSTLRDQAVDYCKPIMWQTYDKAGKISRVRITDLNGAMLLNSFEIKMGKESYTDNTNMVAYLKPGGTYIYNLVNSDVGTEYSYKAWAFNLIMWIDYDQNGSFEKDEIIVSNTKFSVEAQFKIPENARKGVTRMRVRTYLNENVPDNPCASTDGGETEDYTIYITDDSPLYTAEIKLNEMALCKANTYDFQFTTTGSFPGDNVFKVGLYNAFGNFMGYIGEAKSSPVRVKMPADLPIGMNYRMKIIGTEPYFEGAFSKAFRINDIPTGVLSGNQTAYSGEQFPLIVTLDGGGDWTVFMGSGYTTTLGAIQNRLTINIPGEFLFGNPSPGNYEFKAKQIINNGCGTGNITGSAKVVMLDPKASAGYISKVLTSTSYFQKCGNSTYNGTVSFETRGTFGKDNFFTCHLVGPDDRFIANVGFSKSTSILLSIPANIEGQGYKIKVVSSDPYSESPLSLPLAFMPDPAATISGNSSILPGQQASIKLELSGNEPWAIDLSDGNSVVTNLPSQILKVSPEVSTSYTVKRVYSQGCTGNVAGMASVEVLAPRASRLSFQQPSAYCLGSQAQLSIKTDGSFREENRFKVRIFNKNARVSREIEANYASNNVISYGIPEDLPSGSGYQLQLVSTSPYIETDTSETLTLKPVSSAIISSDARDVYEKTKIKLRIDFSGDGPYKFFLSDNSAYSNITQNPFFIEKEADLRVTHYRIEGLFSDCGKGKSTGIVDLNISPLPVITTQAPATQFVCQGSRVYVPFAISNGKFQDNNSFKVEIAERPEDTFVEIPTTMQGDSLFAVIPDGVASGIQFIRVKGTNPMIKGSAVQIIVKSKPEAEIYGNSSVMAGDSSRYVINLSGDAPWDISLSNGTVHSGIRTNTLYTSLLPKKSEDLFITSVRNICGEGTYSGKASIVVHQLSEIEELVKVFPNPYTPESKLIVDSALLNGTPELKILDVTGKELMQTKFEVVSYLSLNMMMPYPAGIYYLQVTTYGRQFLRKLVK